MKTEGTKSRMVFVGASLADAREHRSAVASAGVVKRRPYNRPRKTILGAGLFLVLAGAGGFAAEPVAEGPIIELPKFEVTDSRLLPLPEMWHYAELPGFELLSNISERETKRFSRDFLLLQQVIEMIMPGLTRGQSPVPTALLLCGRGKGFDEFLPPERAEERFKVNGLFFQNPERAAIVVDFALSELLLADNTVEEADPYRAFYLEYFRFLIRRQVSKPPAPWFEEGLVQIFAAMDFNRKWVTFAQIGDGFGAEKIGDFNRRLQQRALIPFKQFLESDQMRSRDTFWAAQSYAWVHMCLYGQNKKFQRPFIKYLARLEQEAPNEDMFKECFGKTYNQMALELRGYLDFTVHTAMQFTAKKGQEIPEPPAIALQAAPDAVVGRLKGEVLRLGGHGEKAHNALIAPYVRGERDPRLLAALGLDERASGRDDRARKFLEAAAVANVDRARAYLELGRLRLAEALAKPAGADGKLDPKQVQAVLAPLNTARTKVPKLAEVYGTIAEAWSNSAEPPKREEFMVVVEGVQTFPRSVPLVLHAALLAAGRGFPEEAGALANHGLKIARDEAQRDRFRLLAAALKRDAAPATEAAAPAPTAPAGPPIFSK